MHLDAVSNTAPLDFNRAELVNICSIASVVIGAEAIGWQISFRSASTSIATTHLMQVVGAVRPIPGQTLITKRPLLPGQHSLLPVQ